MIVAARAWPGSSAARELEARGAAVTVVEARNRVGGRVWTLRDKFAARQHAEAGADLIEGEQAHVLALAKALGLRAGRASCAPASASTARTNAARRRIHTGPSTFAQIGKYLGPLLARLQAGRGTLGQPGRRRDRPAIGDAVARRDRRASAPCKARRARHCAASFSPTPRTCRCSRSSSSSPKSGPPGRDDVLSASRAATTASRPAIVQRLRGALLLSTMVRRVVQHDDRVTVTIEALGKPHTEITAEYFVCALPASTARGVIFEPRAARAAAGRDRTPALRLRDAAAAAVRQALLAQARPAECVRHRSRDRRGLGRQRAAEGAAGHPQLPRRRPRLARRCRTSCTRKGSAA